MNHLKITWFGIVLAAMTFNALAADDWDIPRTADGKPDLQGIWTNATQTPMQRPAKYGNQGRLTAQEAAQIEAGWRNRIANAAKPSDPERGAPTDRNTRAGYNGFWIDRGTNAIQIDNEYRTSIVVDPVDGQIPYVENRQNNDIRSQFRAMPGVEQYDGHELRPLGERCLLSFGSSSGPPMLPVMYNNNYQIVQTPHYVMILVEMVHDVRIIRLDTDHYAHGYEQWMGDSIGHWDGDTLVVETLDFNPYQAFGRASPEKLIVTERFELSEQNKIRYTFTVENPDAYTRPWTGEIAMNRRPRDDKMYEYACHEGNYAFPGILGGARRLEHEAALNNQGQ